MKILTVKQSNRPLILLTCSKKGDLHEQNCLKKYEEDFPGSVFKVPEQNKNQNESFEAWVSRIGNPMEDGHKVIFQDAIHT